MEAWADRIFRTARDAEISDSAIARACGIKQGSVGGWKNGTTKRITGGNLVAVAALLKVSCTWIITGKPAGPHDPPPPPEAVLAESPGLPPLALAIARAYVGLNKARKQTIDMLLDGWEVDVPRATPNQPSDGRSKKKGKPDEKRRRD